MEHSQTEKVKKRYQQISEVQTSLWTFGISSVAMLLWRYKKLLTSFKTLVSKNAETWWFHQNSGLQYEKYKK